MNLRDCYIEEDLFPKIFTDYEEREYGILFFNTDNKDSYDSNHAVIYKDKIHDLQHVLSDITEFYNYVEWCRHNGINNVYIWPDGETPKRIYEEGGYRVVEIRKAGRAVL